MKYKKIVFGVIFVFSILFTWVLRVYHIGVLVPPSVNNANGGEEAIWIDKSQIGINQILLFGDSYHRGREFGRLTRELIYLQEKSLNDIFRSFFPNRFVRDALVLSLIRWFWGVDKFVPDEMLSEMRGVSEFSSDEFNDLADPFTRQFAYHGVHDVGQLFMDYQRDDLGCTIFGTKFNDRWIVGRNFDFEAGRVFDEDKIMKWVFPEIGNAYVSVIWAGMVGVVTGVNDKGLFVSLNAAGSTDFRRYGLPSTLLLAKVMQYASDIEDAKKMIVSEKVLITDIFFLVDRNSKKAYRIEKSPNNTFVEEEKHSFVASNHLQSDYWRDDPINKYRQDELTTMYRFERGKELISSLKDQSFKSSIMASRRILDFMRDKSSFGGAKLHLGNRRAIDSLIATHSVVYDSSNGTLFVNKGPALVSSFVGFDLEQSFRKRVPIVVEGLPADGDLTKNDFYKIKKSFHLIAQAKQFIVQGGCLEANTALNEAGLLFRGSVNYFNVLGDYYHQCKKDNKRAEESWKTALSLHVPYKTQETYLRKMLNE